METENEKLINQELLREAEMIRQGRDRYQRQIKKNEEKGRQSVTPPYIYLQKELLVPLSEGIDNFITNSFNSTQAGARKTSAIPLRDLNDPKKIALIALKGIIDGISLKKTLLQISINIGSMMELEEQSGIFKKNLPYLHSRILKDLMTRTKNVIHRKKVFSHTLRKYEIEHDNWGIGKQVLVGNQLIDLVIKYTGICHLKPLNIGKNKTQNYLVLDPEVEKKIVDGNFKCSVLSPYHKPMITKPKDWTTPFSGGYINEYLAKAPLIKTHDFRYLASLKDTDLKDFYGAVNYLQSVPFKVDKNVLPVFNEIWKLGTTIGGFPQQESYLDPKGKPKGVARPSELDSSNPPRELLVKYKRDLTRIYADEVARSSKVLSTATSLELANEYKEFDEFYFVINADTRGRLYSVGTTYNYQSDQKIKSIICFANGEKLGKRGSYWLYVHAANTWGNDKVTFDERVEFIKSMEREILEWASSPLTTSGWEKADKPMEFLQTCFHIKGYKEQGEDYVCNLPVSVDATCSGLQILSILIRDSSTGSKVNVIPSEKPQDIYTIIASKVETEVRQAAGNGSREANRWLQYGISRQIVKRNIMTYVYGLRPYGARQQIYDEYKKRVELGQKPKCLKDDGFADCKWLSEIVWRHIETEIFLASELMKWFQDTAKLFGQANVSMKWTTPMGFPVVMDYRYLAKFRVKTAIAGSLVYTTLRRQMDKKDTRKFVSSSAPNIVHSLDGAVAQATALQCKLIGNPIPNLMMIHDSFATTPNRIDDLHQVIRDVVVRLFDEDYMEKLYNEFLVNLPDKFKDKLTRPPKKGDMQLQDVKNSLYFFS